MATTSKIDNPQSRSIDLIQSLKHIPDLSDIEKASRKFKRIDFAIIAALIAIDAVLIILVISNRLLLAISGSLLILTLFSFALYYWLSIHHQRAKNKISNTSRPKAYGNFKSKKIRILIKGVLSPHRGKEIPSVYVVEEKYAGAYVINSLFFNSVPFLNAIYISSHLFRVLKAGEVEAVLAHELGHFYNYIRPINQIKIPVFFFTALFPAYVSSFLTEYSIVVSVTVWLLVTVCTIAALRHWSLICSHNHEYLCDLSAARRYGILNIANSLLVLCKIHEIRNQMEKLLYRYIREDDSLSLSDANTLIEQCERLLPNKSVSPNALQLIVEQVLRSNRTTISKKKLSSKCVKEEGKIIDKWFEGISKNEQFDVIDWKRFDSKKRNGRIDKSEYQSLLQILLDEPDAQLHDLPNQNRKLAAKSDHPTLRDRILFLEKCRQNDPSIPI